MEKLIETFQNSIGEALPGVIGALVILLIGWGVAFVIRTILKKALSLCKINERINTKGAKSALDLEGGIAGGGYYVILLMTLLTVFNQLGLEVASQPIQALVTQFLDFIPSLVSGAVLILVAWLCGTIVKQVVTGTLSASGIDTKIKTQKKAISSSLGEVSFWLVFLIFLPGILGIFNLEGLLLPAQSMVDEIMGMLPNILGAVIIIFVGWFIAKIFKEIVSNILAMAGIDKLSEKYGITEKMKLSKLVGTIVYIFIFVPAIVAGLNALRIDAIARPATDMLGAFISAIPEIIAALAIVLITYLVARPVSAFISGLLRSIGFDTFPQKLGIKKEAKSKGPSPSELVGKIVFFFFMLFASVEAANRLNFQQFSDLVAMFIQFGSQVLLGSIIIAVGLWIANVVGNTISKMSSGASLMAGLVRVIILGLVLAMGLRAMGIANDIVNMAFGLTLGAASVAFALAFGIGGREAAGKQMEYWFGQLRDKK